MSHSDQRKQQNHIPNAKPEEMYTQIATYSFPPPHSAPAVAAPPPFWTMSNTSNHYMRPPSASYPNVALDPSHYLPNTSDSPYLGMSHTPSPAESPYPNLYPASFTGSSIFARHTAPLPQRVQSHPKVEPLDMDLFSDMGANLWSSSSSNSQQQLPHLGGSRSNPYTLPFSPEYHHTVPSSLRSNLISPFSQGSTPSTPSPTPPNQLPDLCSRRASVSSRRSSVDSNNGVGKSCSHCHATTTPLWRREPVTLRPLCNACGLYLQQRNKLRPQELIDADKDDSDDSADTGDGTGPECSHCHTHNTSVWRRSKTGDQLCNACGVYVRLKGKDRPLSLKRNKIKPRSKHTAAAS